MTKRVGFSQMALPWRVVGALVLGVLLAKWSWVLFAPRATAIAEMPEHAVAEEAAHLFGMAVSSVSPSEGVALPNVRLVGVFAAEHGKPGFAVLKLDEKQQLGVAVGENVVSGTKLLEVHPDHVLLEHAGMQQRVNLEGMVKGAAMASMVPALK